MPLMCLKRRQKSTESNGKGRDENERNTWVRSLETVIRECSGYKKFKGKEHVIDSLKQRITEADQHLSNIIQQVKNLECLRESVSGKDRKNIDELLASSNNLMDTVKHAIILLQMARNKVEVPATDLAQIRLSTTTMQQQQSDDKSSLNVTSSAQSVGDPSSLPSSNQATVHNSPGSVPQLDPTTLETMQISSAGVVGKRHPIISYSSSDDEDYYDAEEIVDLDTIPNNEIEGESTPNAPRYTMSPNAAGVSPSDETTFDFGDSHENFDEIYDNAEEHDLGNVQQEHGSVLMHLLSQVSIGMDLTKVTLPTFILERRSLLEMYADFFAHPDLFVGTIKCETPEERFVSVVRYYLNAFYAARKSGVAKKPYNPILGETFRCRYNVPGVKPSGKKTTTGPFPGSDENQLTFVAEQVSHHPPVSAFYAEHPAAKISFNAHIYTKSSFLGLSIGVTNIGMGTVTLHDFGESYDVTFPNGYGRSIMSTPWVELGGKVNISCEKTGYNADIEFLTKPFFGGKPHRIQGSLYREGQKKPFLTIRGEWNGVMFAKDEAGNETVFMDVKAKKEMKKECVPVMQQSERESRRLWRHVTAALLRNRIDMATTSKRMIEQRQRAEAKSRLEKAEKWKTIYFHNDSDRWWYDDPLTNRLSTASSSINK
ncbi:hypothetical protein WR25_17961 [Diploscapter pachys]|uniref:Oxysterol-binding protein n=1 Tax=Diploscapter pachys TaxID=2018661 RepID=A0A2A2LN44_9BILA|nr:hypothetical protein WR25_17961 [Diploscapter pachys]